MATVIDSYSAQERDFHWTFCGCMRCVVAVTRGMGRHWQEGCELYHSGKDPAYNGELDTCVRNVEKVEDGEELEFHPGSCVASHSRFGEQSYVEILFLTLDQVVKYCGATAKALNLKTDERPSEDGVGTLTGVPLDRACNLLSLTDSLYA